MDELSEFEGAAREGAVVFDEGIYAVGGGVPVHTMILRQISTCLIGIRAGLVALRRHLHFIFPAQPSTNTH